jgi:hypothetical protein
MHPRSIDASPSVINDGLLQAMRRWQGQGIPKWFDVLSDTGIDTRRV